MDVSEGRAVNKLASASEFKATCLKLIDEMQRTGEPVTIAKRGEVVAEMKPKGDMPKPPLESVFGLLKSDKYRFDDPFSPVSDPADWEANDPAGLYRGS